MISMHIQLNLLDCNLRRLEHEANSHWQWLGGPRNFQNFKEWLMKSLQLISWGHVAFVVKTLNLVHEFRHISFKFLQIQLVIFFWRKEAFEVNPKCLLLLWFLSSESKPLLTRGGKGEVGRKMGEGERGARFWGNLSLWIVRHRQGPIKRCVEKWLAALSQNSPDSSSFIFPKGTSQC